MAESIDNVYVARLFELIAEMLEFKDENPFKIRSYRMASEALGEMQTQVADIAARGGVAELQRIPGIGKSISGQIIEILETGRSSYFDELTKEIPRTVLDLRRVSGIGLKTAQLLYRDFGIKSLEELRTLAENGGLNSVPGIGEKSIERIQSSLSRLAAEQVEK